MRHDEREAIVLPPVTASVRTARRFVAGVACDWSVSSTDDTALVVSELVANALEHGTGPVEVVVHRRTDGLQIEVTTASVGGRPARLDPQSSARSGRGLQIIDALTAAWGYAERRGLLTVWARVLT
jgi:anti-sigma regulatory factor (Ser/Thr protein kinase)